MWGSVRVVRRHLVPMTLAIRPKVNHRPRTTLIGMTPGGLGVTSFVQCRQISKAAKAVLATRKNVKVLDSNISYLDTGHDAEGDNTVVFLHGNPTAAYVWRNVIPEVQGTARCLAPDLIGMGHSGKAPNKGYRFMDHYRYLSAWLDKVDLPEQVTFVTHDWGVALGLHWANEHRQRIQAIVLMEGPVRSIPNWTKWPEVVQKPFQLLRTDAGDEMVYSKNYFVEKMLTKNVMRQLTAEEMEEYRAPYRDGGESRLPTLEWAREVPIAGEPEDVHRVVEAYHDWLLRDSAGLPKLYIHADPGLFSQLLQRTVSRWPSVRTVHVEGLHYLQEDSGPEIGRSITDFLRDVYTNTCGASWHDVRVKQE